MVSTKEKSPEQAVYARRKKVVDHIFEDAVIDLKKNADHRRAAKIYDLIGPILKRRKQAVLATMGTVCERYEQDCPSVDLEHAWALHCSTVTHSIDGLDFIYHITLAMALWMLDELSRTNHLHDALPFLTADEKELEQFILPDCFDPAYDDTTIRGMIHLIHERDPRDNLFQFFINPVSAKRQTPEVYEEVPKDADITQLTPRQKFNAVMAMIHPKLREKAVRRFEEKYWAYVQLVVEGIQQHSAQADRWGKRARTLMDHCEELSEQLHPASPSGGVLLNPSVVNMAVRPFSDEAESASAHSALSKTIREGMEYESKMHEQEEICTAYLIQAHTAFIAEEADLELFPQEDILRLKSFEVDDPYETCFAYLCLVESGSDLPWTYIPAVALLLAAARKLPWTAYLGDADLDEDFWEDLPDTKEMLERKETQPPTDWEAQEKEYRENGPADWIEKKADLYRLKYGSDNLFFPKESPAKDWKLNLPQIVFASTRILMPRTVHTFDGFALDLVKDGMSQDMANGMELYFQLADSCNHGIRYRRAEPAQPEEAPSEPEQEDTAPLQEKLHSAEEELERMREALYDMEHTIKSLRAEKEELSESADEERQELICLRELIYQQANAQSSGEEDCAPSAVSFPYRTSRRIAVFGGHDTWLKAIRPMLPDVTFILRGQSPNPDMIRTQDVIWIQANAMAHCDYNKLIAIVRTNHIPVRYFGFASARKCAEQLVNDLSMLS